MDDVRRSGRLAAYEKLRTERPELFINPPGAAYEILLDLAAQLEVADLGAEAARAGGLPAEFGDIGVLYQDRYVILVRDAVRFPNGERRSYVRICGGTNGIGAAVLPVLEDGSVVLIRHFRHADRRPFWEIPRGFGEPGEDGAATARREVEEELGCTAREIVYLGAFNGDTGLRAGQDELYLARLGHGDFTQELSAEAINEGISEVRAITPDTLRAMLLDGQISDGFLLSAYALASARRLI